MSEPIEIAEPDEIRRRLAEMRAQTDIPAALTAVERCLDEICAQLMDASPQGLQEALETFRTGLQAAETRRDAVAVKANHGLLGLTLNLARSHDIAAIETWLADDDLNNGRGGAVL